MLCFSVHSEAENVVVVVSFWGLPDVLDVFFNCIILGVEVIS